MFILLLSVVYSAYMFMYNQIKADYHLRKYRKIEKIHFVYEQMGFNEVSLIKQIEFDALYHQQTQHDS